MVRTSTLALEDSALDAFIEALEHIGLTGSREVGDAQADPTLVVMVDDREVVVRVEARAYGTGAQVADVVARARPDDHSVPLLVADKITSEARDRLTDAGWSWLDRRGRLHLSAPGVRLDVDVPADPRITAPPTHRAPIAGPGGLAVAYWLCSHRGEAISPNGHAPALGYAPSTISTANRRLVEAGLVGDDGVGLFPELFWELAAAWNPDRVWVATMPATPSASGDPAPRRWCRTGTAAAAAYGAPVVSAGDGPVELYLPGATELSMTVRRLHPTAPGAGAAALAVAQVSAVTERPEAHAGVPMVDGWPAAPMLAVALDLAKDRARGRQILDDWDVDGAVWR